MYYSAYIALNIIYLICTFITIDFVVLIKYIIHNSIVTYAIYIYIYIYMYIFITYVYIQMYTHVLYIYIYSYISVSIYLYLNFYACI